MRGIRLAAVLLAGLAILCSGFAVGLEQYGAAFWKQWDGAACCNYGMVYFLGGVKATGNYGTIAGKTIKQAYVRLVEGSWDSGRCYTPVGPSRPVRAGGSLLEGGRCYTPVGPSRPDGLMYSRTIRKVYDPLAVCKGCYGWLYY